MAHRGAIILVRVLVGWVFLVEGVLKFRLPQELGVGRFTTIGIPAPQAMASFVGGVEIVCGSLVILGLLTRLACIPLLIDIVVAILSTKVPILLGHPLWRFALPNVKHYGIFGMLHEARTDFSMLLGLLFLLIVGPGSLALDGLRAAPNVASRARRGRSFLCGEHKTETQPYNLPLPYRLWRRFRSTIGTLADAR